MQKLIILFIIIGLSLMAGILIPQKFVAPIFENTGYYFILASFLLWVACLFRLCQGRCKAILQRHHQGLLLSILLTAFIFLIAPPKFKVLMDESNLVGISMAMYQTKKVSLPLRGVNLEYGRPSYLTKIDKRPVFFPFLISLVHSVRGYSAYNGFVVNFIAGVLVLFIFYLFIYDHFPRFYALLSLLIFASLPNFVTWVTSSGFETLNLFFILFTIFVFSRVIAGRRVQHAELLFLTLVLVSQCRYESVIFTAAVFFLLPFLLNKNTISRLSIITYLTPVLFLPALWLPRLYAGRPIIDKMAEGIVRVPSLYGAFAWSNLMSNSSANLMVFLGLEPHLGFSPLVSALSIAGIYLMTKRMIVGHPAPSSHFKMMWFFAGTTFFLLYLVQASFYLGNMVLYTQNRFAMTYLPCVVIPAIFVIYRILNRTDPAKKILVCIFFIFHLLYFWSYASQQLLINNGSFTYQYNKTLSYLKRNFGDNANMLVICERPNLYVVHYRGALDFEYANQNAEKILEQYLRELDHVLVLQRYLYATGAPLANNRLNGSYRLAPLADIKLTQSEYLRVSEVSADNY